MREDFVIVGGGQTAAQAAEALRRDGFHGPLVVIGDEPHLPYQRPPLSKKFLTGELARERLPIKPAAFYAEHAVDLRLGRRAVALKPHDHAVTLDDGTTVEYGRLLLATGAVPRALTVPGHTLGGVYYLRTIDDVERIRADLNTARRVAIVGAGYIGLEVAASCHRLGLEVDVIEMADRVMNRVVAPEVSAFYQERHSRAGVRLHLDTWVESFEGDAVGRVRALIAKDGRRFPADVALIGVGIVPVTALAEAAGLHCDNGIAVDEHCRTSDPDIYAAGDCTSYPSLRYGRRVRLESVDNAFEQARAAAANLNGHALAYDRVPWFWSDQYDLKLLIVGLNHGHDATVLRGAPEAGSFSLCYLKDRELLAVDCINAPKDYIAARKLIAERIRVDPSRLRDSTIALKDAVL